VIGVPMGSEFIVIQVSAIDLLPGEGEKINANGSRVNVQRLKLTIKVLLIADVQIGI
jgi:hypothetical protein